MLLKKTHLAVALGGLFALSACDDPSALGLDSNDPNARTKASAAVGAAVGALAGAATARSGETAEAAIKGAIVGGAGGALIGNQLDKQAADLRQSINNDQVGIVNTGDRLIVTLPQDILFATDSFAVRPDLQRDLRAVASNLQAYPNSIIQVVGHTDSDGDAGYNQGLSERRADAVADVLLGQGIPLRRIQTFGRGETQPVASNLTADGKRLNRRVEIVILPTTN